MTLYVVTGAKFHGHAPGEQFDADLDPGQEARAIQRGSIRVVERHDENEEGASGDE